MYILWTETENRRGNKGPKFVPSKVRENMEARVPLSVSNAQSTTSLLHNVGGAEQNNSKIAVARGTLNITNITDGKNSYK